MKEGYVQMKNIRKFLIIIIMCMGLMACTVREDEQEEKVCGGDIVRYSLCIEDDKYVVASCPVISEKKIDSIKLNNYITEQEDCLDIQMWDFEKGEMFEYGGLYTYFVVLQISCKNTDTVVDTNIEKIIFEIDGEIVEYVTPCFNVKNIKYYTCDGERRVDEGNMLFGGNLTGIYGYFPDEEQKANLELVVDRDIVLESYELVDYIEVTELTVNGKKELSENIDTKFEKDDSISLEYCVDVKDFVSKDNIIKTSMVLKYQSYGEKYVWVYSPGLYIWNGYMGYDNIKSYIDNEFE